MLHIYNGIVVVELVGASIEAHVVDEVQRVDRLQQTVVLAPLQLLDYCLRGVEDDTLLELYKGIMESQLTADAIRANISNMTEDQVAALTESLNPANWVPFSDEYEGTGNPISVPLTGNRPAAFFRLHVRKAQP